MKMRVASLVVMVGLVLPVVGRADDAGDAGAPQSDEAFCRRTRTPRVEAAQIRARQWLKRIDTMKASCTVAWVKTGAVKVEPGRVSPELRGDVRCPNGPPVGETKESVWAVLSLVALEPAVVTDEVLSVSEPTLDDANVRCLQQDATDGVTSRPLVSDLPAVRRLVAWKPTRGK